MLLKIAHGTSITIDGVDFVVQGTSMRTTDQSSGLCDELYVVAKSLDGKFVKVSFSGFGISERDLNGLKSLLTSG